MHKVLGKPGTNLRDTLVCHTKPTAKEITKKKLPSTQASPQSLKSELNKTERVGKWSVKGLLAKVTEKLWTTFDRFPKVVQEIVAIFALYRHLKTIRSLETKTDHLKIKKVVGSRKAPEVVKNKCK